MTSTARNEVTPSNMSSILAEYRENILVLEREATASGDLLRAATCQLALGGVSRGTLLALTDDERQQLDLMTRLIALRQVVDAIDDAAGAE